MDAGAVPSLGPAVVALRGQPVAQAFAVAIPLAVHIGFGVALVHPYRSLTAGTRATDLFLVHSMVDFHLTVDAKRAGVALSGMVMHWLRFKLTHLPWTPVVSGVVGDQGTRSDEAPQVPEHDWSRWQSPRFSMLPVACSLSDTPKDLRWFFCD